MAEQFDPNAMALDSLAEPMEGAEMEGEEMKDDQEGEDAKFADIEDRLTAIEQQLGITREPAPSAAPAMDEGDQVPSGLTA